MLQRRFLGAEGGALCLLLFPNHCTRVRDSLFSFLRNWLIFLVSPQRFWFLSMFHKPYFLKKTTMHFTFFFLKTVKLFLLCCFLRSRKPVFLMFVTLIPGALIGTQLLYISGCWVNEYMNEWMLPIFRGFIVLGLIGSGQPILIPAQDKWDY